MSIRGKSKHYRLREIQPRHWQELSERVGTPGLWQRMIALAESAEGALEKAAANLPPKFPVRVIDKISAGIRQQTKSFLQVAQRTVSRA
jgi:serine/threonine-protein kinase HipA